MAEPLLILREITKSFGAVEASKRVSLDLRPGEIHALIGPNGAGKSTLMAQIAGYIRPDSGTVTLNGQDVTNWPAHRRARAGLARSFQISALAMELSVRDNAILGAVGRLRREMSLFRPIRRDATVTSIADAALAQVGLTAVADRRVGTLSHGQRRQLEVAVALTLAPKLFLMDEPMAGLGIEGSAQMVALLDGLRHQAPILLVEHDMDAVFRLADRISVLVAGQIIATGTPAEIRSNPDVRRAYLGEGA